MQIIKKFVSILTTVTLAVCLTACGSDSDSISDNHSSSGTVSDVSSKKYIIGICQLAKQEPLDEATRGFKEALTEKLGESSIEFDEQNAQDKAENCSTIVEKFAADKVDLIMANTTKALQAAAQATKDIPILGTSVTDYGTALNIKDWTGKTGTNVSGTSDFVPLDQQKDMILELYPNVKKLGIIHSSSDPDSAHQSDLMMKALDEDNIKYKEYTVANSNEIQTVTIDACNECDVLYIPADNIMASGAETIKNIVIPAGTPLITNEASIFSASVAMLSINYYDLGYKTGEMAYDILANNKKPGDMEIAFSDTFIKMYNEENCKILNLIVPENYKKPEATSQ